MLGASLVHQAEKEWTTPELAEHAKVSAAYIRQLLLSGKLAGRKRGRDWFIPDSEVNRWLKHRQDKP